MLFQRDNYGFSAPVVFRSTNSRRFRRGQSEGNGYTLGEHWNADAKHHRGALRVSLSTPTDCRRLKAPTFGAPLAKGIAIAYEARLAVDVDKLTELAIITLEEHLPQ